MAMGLVATLGVFTSNELRVVNLPESYSDNFAHQIVGVDPKEYLRQLAGTDFVLLNKIVICESGWKPWAKNSTSSASGLFQFLNSTWASWGEGDVFDPYANIEAGVKLYNARGTSPWLASKNCWSN